MCTSVHFFLLTNILLESFSLLENQMIKLHIVHVVFLCTRFLSFLSFSLFFTPSSFCHPFRLNFYEVAQKWPNKPYTLSKIVSSYYFSMENVANRHRNTYISWLFISSYQCFLHIIIFLFQTDHTSAHSHLFSMAFFFKFLLHVC